MDARPIAHSPRTAGMAANLSRASIERAIARELLRARKFGRRVIIEDQDLVDFIHALPATTTTK